MDERTARRGSTLPSELAREAERIEAIARGHGLDFFPVVFEHLDAAEVNGLAAYGGFPVRYPSWRHGMEYERLEKGHQWGLSRIYELVINNDPVYAYLVRSNSRLEQKLVMAHVFGHADFFRHNSYFAGTDRRMLDAMAAHSTRMRRTIDVRGLEALERFLDQSLSIENLIDPYLPLRAHLKRSRAGSGAPPPREEGSGGGGAPERARSTPTYDVLGYLVEHADLADWERDVLEIVRAEAYYFQPQRMTRILNEGWASFWHSRILTGGVLDDSEIIDFADCHSGATQASPGRLNPYKLGIELFRHAERRGLDLFRLRRIHSDASLIDELIDEEFVEREELFLLGRNARSGRLEVADRDWRAVKRSLLADLAWGGLPRIELASVDAQGKGELDLVHHHDGRDLDLAAAGETLLRLEAIWKKPAVLLTREDGRGRRLTAAGGRIETVDTDEGGPPAAREEKSA